MPDIRDDKDDALLIHSILIWRARVSQFTNQIKTNQTLNNEEEDVDDRIYIYNCADWKPNCSGSPLHYIWNGKSMVDGSEFGTDMIVESVLLATF